MKLIGGKDVEFERSRMHHVNVIICTPGRLLQHMDENPLFDCNNLQVRFNKIIISLAKLQK